ncbi:MAG TPA: TM0106 family RecB-like putative nuclease [Acidimicrobiales bacterium]|nr:TM0106 family RecB-like putative nuclease [Acidimicrobiales bacterium]
MAEYLRSDEVLACVHRIALTRGAPFHFTAPPLTPELERRRRAAHEHRQQVFERIAIFHPEAVTPSSVDETSRLMREGCELIVRPRLAHDDVARRSASVHLLVRVGRNEEHFAYAPILIKNHEVVESASTRRTLEGSLERLRPSEAQYIDGYGTRAALPMTRSGLSLAQATRVLEAHGLADPAARAGVIDRQGRLWWFDLATNSYPRFSLATYDRLHHERLDVLLGHEEWMRHDANFPTAPYWHRDCPDCPFREHCEEQLEKLDDVSLVRFTSFSQQLLLREHGVETRAQLARLDPELARRARGKVLNPLEPHKPEEVLGRTIDKLDDLIYRARAFERGTSLRVVASNHVGCPTADIEVDVDMESYDDATYLWGASVTVNEPTTSVSAGYYAFVEWDELTRDAEANIFREFWTWLEEIRRLCANEGRTFAAYCFWAQAEDGAMNRAVDPPLPDGPTAADLMSFRKATPPVWIDLHEQVKRQIQTEGPFGLKQLAVAAGFHWRDPNPSGEASMLWYEVARGDTPDALASRERIMAYNEDDCRATKALRDWLNGPARHLAHRDDPL